jgi:hypothetical protein
MSQFPNENDGNRSVAASDFVQLGQPDDEEVKVFRCSEDDQQDEEMMTPETELEETPNAFCEFFGGAAKSGEFWQAFKLAQFFVKNIPTNPSSYS